MTLGPRAQKGSNDGTGRPSPGLALFLVATTWTVFVVLVLAGWTSVTGGAMRVLDQIVGSATVTVAVVVAALCVVRSRLTADRRYMRVGLAILAFGGLRVGLGLVVVPLLPGGGGDTARAIVAGGFLASLGLLLVPSLDAFPLARRRVLRILLAVLSVAVLTVVLATPEATKVLAGETLSGDVPLAAVPQVLVTAIWLIAARSYWREARASGKHFDVGVAMMLFTLAQSRLSITLATLTSSSWVAASQMFRFEAILMVAIGLNRDLHSELLHSQVALDRLLTERRHRDRVDAERRHDVRSALFSVVAAAETLERHNGRLDATTREFLVAALSSETLHLQNLVLQEAPEDIEPFSLLDIVRPLVVLEEARGQNMRLRVDDDVVVFGRRSQAAEAIRNVLDNARKHGGSLVAVRIARHGDTGVVVIEDSGPGVPVAEQTRIFERGERGSSSNGSGLGLYVAARLLRDMHGDLWLDTDRKHGAAFTCCLPAASAVIDLRDGTAGAEASDPVDDDNEFAQPTGQLKDTATR